MHKYEKEFALQYCWITFNLRRANLPLKKSDGTVKVKSDRVQELQEYEKTFVSKIKRNK